MIPSLRKPITIQNHTIQPSKSHKFLGIIIDENLNFKEQAAHALAKGTKYVMACTRMIHPTKGIHGKLMKRLYEGVIVPKMLYAMDIWCVGLISKGRGKKGGGRGARGFTLQLARVQRMATLQITGGLRSSPSDMLDAHANILPIQQIIRKNCHRATLRMATLLSTHPLVKGIKSAYLYCEKRNFKGRKRQPSPLHKLMNEFQIDPTKMEKIAPIRHYPKWEPDMETHIAKDVELAAIEDTTASEDLRVYSNGSMINGGVGGAAVAMRGEMIIGSKRFYWGSEKDHTVHEVEIVGMILAVQILKEKGGGVGRSMALGIDNQAAIKATTAFSSQPGHYLMDIFHDDLRQLIQTDDSRKLVIRWTLCHKGIAGNKVADVHVKRAARGESSPASELPKSLLTKQRELLTLPQSKLAIQQCFNKYIKEEANTVIASSPRITQLRSVDPSAPSPKFTKVINTLPRHHSSLLFQL
jgi:ribonuclease HI